ncbi:hypothetical protein [Streptomyces rhizosphaerihabitans]|uniref:hypothetical protein n=1 Tax=Streptomyces rhizosphaerihabitans TaxID=1266770 RepID=UPI0021C08703|nr:hypothetical protein [Streptomyces rhizosphaerihabitans]MCT9010565.1 hypothetical protein [Streptomyces rhizosphaerihabitans]
MTPKSSRELMAWQPPDGWREMSSARRRAYLEEHGFQVPLRPADWDDMEREQRMVYLDWNARIWSDTPERRAAEGREHRKKLQAWWRLMWWWIGCLAAALGLVWWPAGPFNGSGVAMQVGFTVFVLVGYYMALFVPMRITKPVPSIHD